MVMHELHKSDLSEGSDEFAHFPWIQKVLPEGSDFDNVFFCLFVFLDDPNTTISGPTSYQWWPNIYCWLGNLVIFQGIRISIN